MAVSAALSARIAIAVCCVVVPATALGSAPARAATPGSVAGPSDDTPARCASAVKDCPTADPFFRPPSDLAARADGAVVGSRTVSLNSPEVSGVAAARTVTYKSVDTFGVAVLDVTTLIVPSAPWLGSGPRPLVSFQFAEDSLGRQCAPDYALGTGHTGTNGVVDSEATYLDALLAQGIEISAPSYEGPAEQFAAGVQEGHAVLDGIRASEAVAGSGLTAATPVGMLGYSGGALATGWASELMPTYAPGLHVVGVAEGGVPTDLKSVARSLDGGPLFGLVAMGLGGVDRGYPQAGLHADLNAAGKKVFATVATECASTALTQYPLRSLDEYTVVPDSLDDPQFAPMFAAVHLLQRVPTVPIYDFQALADEVVPYASSTDLVAYYCAHGVSVTQVSLPGEHVTGEAEGEPGAIAWLTGRFDGVPVTSTCALAAAPVSSAPSAPTVTRTAAPAAGQSGAAAAAAPDAQGGVLASTGSTPLLPAAATALVLGGCALARRRRARER